MEIPYYLNPNVKQEGDPIFNIPIYATPAPGVEYDDVKSIWETGMEGAQSIIDKAGEISTEYVSTTIDVLKRAKENVVGTVSTPFEYVQTAFNYSMWLMIAWVLTIVYLVVK